MQELRKHVWTRQTKAIMHEYIHFNISNSVLLFFKLSIAEIPFAFHCNFKSQSLSIYLRVLYCLFVLFIVILFHIESFVLFLYIKIFIYKLCGFRNLPVERACRGKWG